VKIEMQCVEEAEAGILVEFKAPKINVSVKKEGKSKGWWSFADEDMTIEDARALRDALTKAIRQAERYGN
jgi:hypothetical protein